VIVVNGRSDRAPMRLHDQKMHVGIQLLADSKGICRRRIRVGGRFDRHYYQAAVHDGVTSSCGGRQRRSMTALRVKRIASAKAACDAGEKSTATRMPGGIRMSSTLLPNMAGHRCAQPSPPLDESNGDPREYT
jgi:hypothetical protein